MRNVLARILTPSTSCLSLLAGLSACSSTAEPANGASSKGVTYETVTCSFTPPAGQSVTCGVLTVPEDRSKPSLRAIKIPVATIKGAGTGLPLVYIPGGPGGGAIWSISQASAQGSALVDLAKGRDIIVYDPRGTGNS